MIEYRYYLIKAMFSPTIFLYYSIYTKIKYSDSWHEIEYDLPDEIGLYANHNFAL